MAPHCAVNPMECTHSIRSDRRQRRAIPLPPVSTSNDTPSASSLAIASSEKILIISVSILGILVLIIVLLFLFVCKKRRRASRRIGQLQKFLPTFMDEKATEEYFKKQPMAFPLASTLETPPSNIHHRTHSAPVAFSKIGLKDSSLEVNSRSDSDRQFQHTIFPEETYAESEDEIALKRSLSGRPRNRASTVDALHSTLHSSVSLNNHGTSGYISRTPPIDEEGTLDYSDSDALPTATNTRIGKMKVSKPSFSREHNSTGRFTTGIGYQAHHRSTSSPMEFNPSQFPSSVNTLDLKRRQASSGLVESSDEDSDDDTASTASSDGFDYLPAHQMHHNFESHDPYISCGDRIELDEEEGRESREAKQGSSRQLESQNGVSYISPTTPAPLRVVEGIAFRRNAPPLPSRIILPRPHGGQSVDPVDDAVDL